MMRCETVIVNQEGGVLILWLTRTWIPVSPGQVKSCKVPISAQQEIPLHNSDIIVFTEMKATEYLLNIYWILNSGQTGLFTEGLECLRRRYPQVMLGTGGWCLSDACLMAGKRGSLHVNCVTTENRWAGPVMDTERGALGSSTPLQLVTAH